VLAAEAGQHDVEMAGSELAHRLAHRNHRLRDAAAEQHRKDDAEQSAAEREHHDQVLGISNHRMGFRFETLLFGDQIGLHRAGALVATAWSELTTKVLASATVAASCADTCLAPISTGGSVSAALLAMSSSL